MAHKIRETLTYDFNYNLFLVKTMLSNVRNIREREIVIRWLRFLKSAARTIDEMKLRNDFMYYLVLNVREGSLKIPFDKPPENVPLMTMVPLLPEDFESDQPDPASLGRKSELLRRSPDGGEFLLAQPPDVGAFCYMAVVTKHKGARRC